MQNQGNLNQRSPRKLYDYNTDDLVGGPYVKRPELGKIVTEDKLLTTKQAAELAGVDPSTMSRAAKLGMIPGAQKPGHDWILPESGVRHWMNTPEFHRSGVKKGTKRTK